MFFRRFFILFILFFSFCRVLSSFSLFQQPKKLVMINPAGDAKNVGRKLVEGFERGVTLQFSEEIQKGLTDKYGHRVVLTRSPGEAVLPLQNASYANRSKADFFLSLHVYRQEEPKPKVIVYHLLYNPMVDLAQNNFNSFTFVPIHQAHFQNISRTVGFANNVKSVLNNGEFKKKLDFYGPYGLPFKPLVGIVAPSIAIEVGICEDNNWKHLVEPIVEGLNFLENL